MSAGNEDIYQEIAREKIADTVQDQTPDTRDVVEDTKIHPDRDLAQNLVQTVPLEGQKERGKIHLKDTTTKDLVHEAMYWFIRLIVT